MLHRILLTVITALTLIFSFTALPAYAVGVFPGCEKGGNLEQAHADVCQDVNPSGNPVIDTIKNVINILSFAVVVAAVIILIISGLRMVLSGDEANAIAQARSGIIYALAGIAVTVLAQGIVVFVLNRIK